MKTILSFAAVLVAVGGMAACTDSDANGRAGAGGEGGEPRASTTGGDDTGGDDTGGDDTGGDDTGGDDTGGDDTGGDDTGGDDTGGDDTGGGDTGGGEIRECSEEIGDDCRDCCLQRNIDGADALASMMFEFCGCAAAAPCATQCNTPIPSTDVCADDGSINIEALGGNTACLECTRNLGENAACIGQLAAACAADEACLAYIECARDCTGP